MTSPESADAAPQGQHEFALLSTLFRNRWRVLIAAALVTVVCGVIAIIIPKSYRAVVLVAPVEEEGGSGKLGSLGGIVSGLGGLSSLAGISLPEATRKAEALATIQSQALTTRFIQERALLPVLFPSKWDDGKKTWKVSGKKVPTLWQGNELFRRNIRNVVENKKSGLVMITIEWTDPVVAADWANEIVKMTNNYLRSKAIEESQRRIDFLRKQASKTDIVGVQSAVYSVLESEIRKITLAEGTDEYAFKVVDPAVVPEKPISPRTALWVVTGFMLGFLAAILWILVAAWLGPIAKAL